MCGILTASGGWIGKAALDDPSISLERLLEAAGVAAPPAVESAAEEPARLAG